MEDWRKELVEAVEKVYYALLQLLFYTKLVYCACTCM